MAHATRSDPTPPSSAKRTAPIAVVCAWCRVPIVRVHAYGAVVSTSHGLCAPCARRLSRKIGR